MSSGTGRVVIFTDSRYEAIDKRDNRPLWSAQLIVGCEATSTYDPNCFILNTAEHGKDFGILKPVQLSPKRS